MRGDVERQTMILSAGTPDQLIPEDHPIRLIKPMVDQDLTHVTGATYYQDVHSYLKCACWTKSAAHPPYHRGVRIRLIARLCFCWPHIQLLSG